MLAQAHKLGLCSPRSCQARGWPGFPAMHRLRCSSSWRAITICASTVPAGNVSSTYLSRRLCQVGVSPLAKPCGVQRVEVPFFFGLARRPRSHRSWSLPPLRALACGLDEAWARMRRSTSGVNRSPSRPRCLSPNSACETFQVGVPSSASLSLARAVSFGRPWRRPPAHGHRPCRCVCLARSVGSAAVPRRRPPARACTASSASWSRSNLAQLGDVDLQLGERADKELGWPCRMPAGPCSASVQLGTATPPCP
jgi:hypothetical protein